MGFKERYLPNGLRLRRAPNLLLIPALKGVPQAGSLTVYAAVGLQPVSPSGGIPEDTVTDFSVAVCMRAGSSLQPTALDLISFSVACHPCPWVSGRRLLVQSLLAWRPRGPLWPCFGPGGISAVGGKERV